MHSLLDTASSGFGDVRDPNALNRTVLRRATEGASSCRTRRSRLFERRVAETDSAARVMQFREGDHVLLSRSTEAHMKSLLSRLSIAVTLLVLPACATTFAQYPPPQEEYRPAVRY